MIYLRGAKPLVGPYVKVKAGEMVPVMVDDEAFSVRMGNLLLDVASTTGANCVLAEIKQRTFKWILSPKV